MSAADSELDSNAGEHALRLDADRTRDELAETLAELRQRLTPKELARSAKTTFLRHRAPFVAAGSAVALLVTGLVVVKVRSARHG